MPKPLTASDVHKKHDAWFRAADKLATAEAHYGTQHPKYDKALLAERSAFDRYNETAAAYAEQQESE